MKKIFILMASAVLMLAASCNKMEEVNTPVDTPADTTVETPAETETITVQLNPGTKTSLGEEGTATIWSQGDAVDVTTGGTYLGTLYNNSNLETFSGEIKAGTDGGKNITLYYPSSLNGSAPIVPDVQKAVENSFDEGAAVLEGYTTMADLRAGKPVTMKNMTALLKFSVAQDGDVTFEVGTKKYTITDCKTGSTYYACVEPASNVSFVARIGGYLSRKASKNATFNANDVLNLNELPAPVSSGWALPGDYNNWALTTLLYEEGELYVVKSVDIKSTGFKFNHKDFGWKGIAGTSVKIGEWHKFNGENNIKIASNTGKCDLYMTKGGTRFQAVPEGNPIPQLPEGMITPKQGYLYLNPNMWNVDNARFAAYFFGNGEKWESMTDPDKDGIYEVQIPTDKDYPKVIFCRMNGNASANNWNNKWNQSGDLEVPKDGANLFTPSSWDNATTTWSHAIEF